MDLKIGKVIYNSCYNVITWDDVILNLKHNWRDILENKIQTILLPEDIANLNYLYCTGFPAGLIKDIEDEAGDILFQPDTPVEYIGSLIKVFHEITTKDAFE